MNLQIIAGPSGAGKSTFIYKKILKEAQENPKKHYLILVPLQYSMQTQRILVFLSPRKSIINVDVLSFERLAYRVFDELGSKKNVCLDETGKVLLIRRAASLIEDDLGLLRKNISRRGYIDEVKSLISELMQYGYEPSDVGEMAERSGLSETFKEKASDIEKLYSKFLELLDESTFTQEQVLSLLCDVADQSEILKDSVIVLDGYTGFTPVQKEFLTRLVPLVDTIYACVTCDKDCDLYTAGEEEELFYMPRSEAAFLNGLKGAEIKEPVFIDGKSGRFKEGGPIAFLEENLFREKGVKPYSNTSSDINGSANARDGVDKLLDIDERESKSSDGKAIELLQFRDIKLELTFAAEKIHQMVRKDESLHYRDFAIVCPDSTGYRYVVKQIFDAQGIPVFLDERQEALFNPLTEFVDAAFDMVKRRLSYESVMRFIRSGLVPLSTEETDTLDNYLYEASFRNTRYLTEPFKRKTQDFTEEEQFEELNAIRARISDPIMKFYNAEKGKNATVTARLSALFELLMTFNAEKQLDAIADQKKADGDMVAEDLYRRLYKSLCGLADQMAELLGDTKVNFSDFKDMLLDGMDQIKPATVPKSNDTVIFGDLERTRLSDIKVLFLIGAGDDQIPKSGGDAGIFSEEERIVLKENGFELAPTEREKSAQQKFYLYLALTKPTKKIFITYHEVGSDGDVIKASYLFEEIKKLFSDVDIVRVSPDDPVFLETQNSADAVMTRGLEQIVNGEISDQAMERISALLTAKRLSGKNLEAASFINAAFSENKKTSLRQAVTDALYGMNLTMSVSRLETFAKCPCSYLLTYGLKLLPRKKNEFASLDLGNLYHGAIEKYARGLKADNLSWDAVDAEEMQCRLKSSFNEELKDFSGSELFEDAREDHFSKQAFSNLLLNTKVMTEAIKVGSFAPSYFEMALKNLCTNDELTFDLDSVHSLTLEGRIDRIDLAEKGNRTFVKIIDYKTGNNKLDGTLIYQGIQLQLLLYMDMAVKGLSGKSKNETEVLPAAAFYYMIKDPTISLDKVKPGSDITLEIEKELRPSGVVINDGIIIGALDENLVTQPSYHSTAVALSSKKDKSPAKSDSLVSAEDFGLIRQFAQSKALSLAGDIVKGNVSVFPYKRGDDTGCKYCIYKGVCHFDTRLRGYYYRNIDHCLDPVQADGTKQAVDKNQVGNNGQSDDKSLKSTSLSALLAKIKSNLKAGKEGD